MHFGWYKKGSNAKKERKLLNRKEWTKFTTQINEKTKTSGVNQL
jgi:hypothetical protein